MRPQAAQKARELEIESQRAQDAALQAHLDQIGQLLHDKERPLRQSKEGDEVRTLARARTLAILRGLQPDRKASLLRFLYEADLLGRSYEGNVDYREWGPAIVNVRDADLKDADMGGIVLSGADLSGVDLRRANLSQAMLMRTGFFRAALDGTILRSATLYHADLREARLVGADRSGADLDQAHLDSAKLRGANLSYANLLYANLIGADMTGGKLIGVDLGGANVSAADLSGADLRDSGIPEEGLNLLGQEVKSLKGATMPNGQLYEHWLNSEGRGVDGENSGPS